MNKSVKYGLFALACIIIFVLGILTSGYSVTLPGIDVFGFIFIGFILGFDVFLEYSKAKTAQVIASIEDNEGHWGINKRDVLKRRLYFDTINTETEQIERKELGLFYIFLVGGVDYSGFSMRSHSDSAVIICHDKYVQIEGMNYHLTGSFLPMKYKQAGRCLHKTFEERGLRGRIKPPTKFSPGTPIYFAATGYIDFSDTRENKQAILKMMDDNEHICNLSQNIADLYKMLNRDKATREPTLVERLGVKDED